jgi:hypothetical protein
MRMQIIENFSKRKVINKEAIYLHSKGPKPAIEKPLDLNIKEHRQSATDEQEEPVSNSYKQLVSTLGTRSQFFLKFYQLQS